MGEIEDRDRIRDGVGGEKSFLVGGESEGFRIAAAKHLAGKLGGERVAELAAIGVEDVDLVAIGKGDEEARVISREE